jgi:hypothetical protein
MGAQADSTRALRPHGRRLWLIALLLAGATSAAAADSGLTISPSGDSVPENLLRIELNLAQPVDGPLDMRRVHLLDDTGARIDDALLDLALPSTDGKSVAILMHPGRIKSGVGPNVVLGVALHAGVRVTLVVDDPTFGPMVKKQWLVAPALRAPIATAQWRVHAPAAGTRAPLMVTLPAPLNASADQLIGVAAANGQRVPGAASLQAGETEWRLLPTSPWRAGDYALRIHPSIEDPAGNRLCAAFEQAHQSELACDADATIRFTIL